MIHNPFSEIYRLISSSWMYLDHVEPISFRAWHGCLAHVVAHLAHACRCLGLDLDFIARLRKYVEKYQNIPSGKQT